MLAGIDLFDLPAVAAFLRLRRMFMLVVGFC